jgi:hypothetical protein
MELDSKRKIKNTSNLRGKKYRNRLTQTSAGCLRVVGIDRRDIRRMSNYLPVYGSTALCWTLATFSDS